jgi:hypothetical protein
VPSAEFANDGDNDAGYNPADKIATHACVQARKIWATVDAIKDPDGLFFTRCRMHNVANRRYALFEYSNIAWQNLWHDQR